MACLLVIQIDLKAVWSDYISLDLTCRVTCQMRPESEQWVKKIANFVALRSTMFSKELMFLQQVTKS